MGITPNENNPNHPNKLKYKPKSKSAIFRLESIKDAQAEDQIRLSRSLMPAYKVAVGALKKQIRELIWSLEDASEAGSSATTLASKAVYRKHRVRWDRHVDGLVEASTGHPMSKATLLPCSFEIPDEDLEIFSAGAFRNSFVSYLNRRGINKCKGWLIGGLHGEYDSIRKVWRIHWHLLVCGEMISVIDGLRKEADFKSVKGEAPRVRMSRKPLTDIPRLASYLLQSWWPNRPTGQFANDGVNHRKNRSRLPEPQQARWLLWMHQAKLSDLIIVKGLRRTPSGFKIKKL